MTIDEDLHGSFLDLETLEPLLLNPGLETNDPEVWSAVFAKRFDLGAKSIADEAKSFCRQAGEDRESVMLCRKKIAARIRSRDHQEARRLSRQIRPPSSKALIKRRPDATPPLQIARHLLND